MLSEHKDTILENFLSSAIRTLNTDEIYNILIDSLILMLNPQGLLLTQNLNTRRSFYTVFSLKKITPFLLTHFSKRYCTKKVFL